MVQYLSPPVDLTFSALADGTRRGILELLARQDASITTLASRFQMTLTGMKKHIAVLEAAGLVTSRKVGRVRTCALGAARLEQEAAWIDHYRRLWTARFDTLDAIVEELQHKENTHGRPL